MDLKALPDQLASARDTTTASGTLRDNICGEKRTSLPLILRSEEIKIMNNSPTENMSSGTEQQHQLTEA